MPTADPILELAAGIAAAYLSRHSVPIAEIPDILRIIHHGLVALGAPAPDLDAQRMTPDAIRASIHDDHLVSFISGREYRTLRRHLTAFGLTPDSYREKFGLPTDYPMVAPGYSAKRSEIAKAIQLGGRVASPARVA